MKILFIFCDMLRANLLKTFNENIQEKGLMDHWFEKLGGTCFTNCYTPAPDTPRSLACLYSGKYPKHNGCCSRLHWPKYYLKEEIFTIFDLLEKNNYLIFVRIEKGKEKMGALPAKNYENIRVFDELNEFLDKLEYVIDKNKNIFSFISLTDYHWAMDEYSHNSWGDYYGQRHLSNCFEKIFSRFPADTFDYIFIFSDHGIKFNKELRTQKKIYLINDDRSKIVLFVRKKGCDKIIKKSKLTSILDILPTLTSIMNDNDSHSFDGISLFEEAQNRFIIIEDYLRFPPGILATHELLGIRTDNHFYLSNLTDSVLLNVLSANEYEEEKNPDEFIIKELKTKVGDITCSYSKNKQLNNMLEKYKLMKKHWKLKKVYSDGEKRKTKHWPLFRLLMRLWENRYNRW